MSITYPAYNSICRPEPPKSFIGIYAEFCNGLDPKPIYCEVPDELRENRIQLPNQSPTFTSITYSGTASGVSTSMATLPLQYRHRCFLGAFLNRFHQGIDQNFHFD